MLSPFDVAATPCRHNFDKGAHMPSAAKREHVFGPDAVTLRFIFRPLSSRFFKPQLNNHGQFLEAVGQPGVQIACHLKMFFDA